MIESRYIMMLNGHYQFLSEEQAKYFSDGGWLTLCLVSTGDFLAMPTERMQSALTNPCSPEYAEYLIALRGQPARETMH